jgi:S-disulfanyl-L-cysteine oxidoreductase SoxD
MFSFPKTVVACALLGLSAVSAVAAAPAEKNFPGVGRNATAKEVAAWDIDVRPDFKGLPAGSGTVAKGQDIWEAKCAQCHGFFGESGEVFSPLVGGVTKEDIKSGHVANLTATNFPGRTTFMKVATLSTIWDYINRAMPWNAPKSLSTDEVYAVTAFLLSLNGIVPDDFTLSDKNIREVQERMPNRKGMTTAHSMWPGQEFQGVAKADTHNVACMKDCAPEPKLASMLPDFARNAHGNLAEQNRLVGAQHGADTTRPERKAGVPAEAEVPAKAQPAKADAASAEGKPPTALLQKYICTACHGIDRKIVGPAFTEVSKKYPGQVDYLSKKILAGGSGVWGPIPMPAQKLSEAEARTIATWLAGGANK